MSTVPDIVAFRRWRVLNVVDGRRLWRRWSARRGPNHADPLIDLQDDGDVEPPGLDSVSTWTVGRERDLIRLIGALHHVNPRLTLWFRGQVSLHETAGHWLVPSRGREPNFDGAGAKRLCETLLEVEHLASRYPIMRNRGPLARLALLQHYGAPTSLLDVTRDLRAATFFATRRLLHEPCQPVTVAPEEGGYILVFATPRQREAVADMPELGLVAVDLSAEMPSYCLRPHCQQAGFIALRSAALLDLACASLRPSDPTLSSYQAQPGLVELDSICIARIKVAFDPAGLKGLERVYFPPASKACTTCSGDGRSDYADDTALHVLRCGGLTGLPSFYWEET